LRGEIACLIIDEAAQATEPNLLIALQTGVQKVLLIGDPYQLPATCMSADCNVTLFNRSLFERFLDAGNKPYFLNIQYRMAPMIRTFPSRRFYQNRLIDAASVAERAVPPFLECFNGRSVAFVDIKYSREEARSNSCYNEAEARAVGMLVKCLSAPDVSMGIITPYQAQRSVIAREARN
jgi:superfamily I DNA and/or RNA helicase